MKLSTLRRASAAALGILLAALALHGWSRAGDPPVPAANLPLLRIAGAPVRTTTAPAASLVERIEEAFGPEGAAYARNAGDRPELWAVLYSPSRLERARALAAVHGTAPALDFAAGLARARLSEEDEQAIAEAARTLSPRSFRQAAAAPRALKFLVADEAAVWTILDRGPDAAFFDALEALPLARIGPILRWAAEDGRRARLVAALPAGALLDDLGFLESLARLDEPDCAAAFLAAAHPTLRRLAPDDRAWLASLLEKNPDHLPCLATLLLEWRDRYAAEPAKADAIEAAFLKGYLLFDVAALFTAVRFREVGAFNEVLERGQVLALPLIAAEIEIDEQGAVAGFAKADEELALIHDRGELYLDDYEIGDDGQVKLRWSAIGREAVPGGDVYKAGKLLVNGKRVTLAEAGLALLDAVCLIIDVGSLGGAAAAHTAAKSAAKTAVKTAKLATKMAAVARLGRLAGGSSEVRRSLSSILRPGPISRIGRLLWGAPDTLSFKFNAGTVIWNGLDRTRGVPARAMDKELARLAAHLRALRRGETREEKP